MANTRFSVPCPSCEASVPIKGAELIGKKTECPKCKYRFVVPDPGHLLWVYDFAQIEARLLLWRAGDKEMLENCKRYIASCHDPRVQYTSPQRRIEELEAEVEQLRGMAYLPQNEVKRRAIGGEA